MQVHEWRENTPDGDKRYNRAKFHAGRWTFETTLKSEPDWNTLEHPDRDYLEALYDVIWRKYQRKRIPHDHVEYIQSLIDELPEAPVEQEEGDA